MKRKKQFSKGKCNFESGPEWGSCTFLDLSLEANNLSLLVNKQVKRRTVVAQIPSIMSMIAVTAKRRTPISLSKALATFGCEQWSSLDPGKRKTRKTESNRKWSIFERVLAFQKSSF